MLASITGSGLPDPALRNCGAAAVRPCGSTSLIGSADGALELRLGHRRASGDALSLRLLVELSPSSGHAGPSDPTRSPPRRPDEMSSRESRDDSAASPCRARSLFTVRAAISSAVSSERPDPSASP